MAKHKPEDAIERLVLKNLPGAEEDFAAGVDRIARVFNEHGDDCDDEGRGPFALKDGCLEASMNMKVTFRHDPLTGATEVVVGVETKLPGARTKRGHALLKGDTFLIEPDQAAKPLSVVKNKESAK